MKLISLYVLTLVSLILQKILNEYCVNLGRIIEVVRFLLNRLNSNCVEIYWTETRLFFLCYFGLLGGNIGLDMLHPVWISR